MRWKVIPTFCSERAKLLSTFSKGYSYLEPTSKNCSTPRTCASPWFMKNKLYIITSTFLPFVGVSVKPIKR